MYRNCPQFKKVENCHHCKNSLAIVPNLTQRSGCLDTDVYKSSSPTATTATAAEEPDEPDGPLVGSASDQEKKASTFRYSYSK